MGHWARREEPQVAFAQSVHAVTQPRVLPHGSRFQAGGGGVGLPRRVWYGMRHTECPDTPPCHAEERPPALKAAPCRGGRASALRAHLNASARWATAHGQSACARSRGASCLDAPGLGGAQGHHSTFNLSTPGARGHTGRAPSRAMRFSKLGPHDTWEISWLLLGFL